MLDAARARSLLVEGRWAAPLLLVLLVMVAYHRAPENVFHFDDDPNFALRKSVQIDELSWHSVKRVLHFGALERRVLPNFTLAFVWWRGDGNPAPFQWTNATLHLVNTLILFALLSLLLSPTGPPTTRLRCAAAAGAAVWAVHPIQVQAVTYVVQRMTSMAALFVLVSVWAWGYGRLRAHRLWPYALLALVSAVAAISSKENARVLPVLIILLELGICRHNRPFRRPLDQVLFALPILAIIAVVVDLLFEGPVWQHFSPSFAGRDFTLEERLLTQPRVIAFHASQLIWPLPGRFSLLHDFDISRGILSPPSTLAAFVATLTWIGGGTALLLRARSRRVGFFILWIPATLVIESSFVALELIFEHRMYLPTVGLAGLAAIGVARLQNRRLATVVTATTLAALLTSTLIRVPVWSSRERLFEQVATRAPGQVRVWNALGGFYGDMGRYEKAASAFERASALEPNNPRTRYGLGLLWTRQDGTSERALEEFDRAIATKPNFAEALVARGNLHMRSGDYARAIEDYDTAVAASADNSLAFVNRAVCRLRLGQYERALHDLDTALHIDRDAPRAHTWRGGALLALGRVEPALQALNTAVERDADDMFAQFWRGDALIKRGHHADGAASLRRSCELGLRAACLAVDNANMPPTKGD